MSNVLVVDLDPQSNATQYLMGVWRYQKVLHDGKPTIWHIFEQYTRTPAGRTGTVDPRQAVRNVAKWPDGHVIDLIPSQLELALSLKQPGQKERFLSRTITALKDEYDLVLIDCAPTESVLTTAAYLASDYVLVPVKPEYLSTIGLPLLANSMRDFQEQHENHSLEVAGIVFNATEGYSPEETKSKAEVKRVAHEYGWHVFESEITKSKSYPKGAREGKPIFGTSYARTGPAARFYYFAKEFAERIGLPGASPGGDDR
jgi:chromosome partitioning protein